MKTYMKILLGLILLIFLVMVINSYNAYKSTMELNDRVTDFEQRNTPAETIDKNSIKLSIESVFEKDTHVNIVLRNTGSKSIDGNVIKTYIDNQVVDANGCDLELNVRDVCTLELTATPFPKEGETITIKIIPIEGGREEIYLCAGMGRKSC